MLSTHLTSCPKFLAMAPDARLAVVLANAGCSQCAAWDHSEHKYAGGRTVREPKCSVVVNGSACGGAHGRWFHEGASVGSSNSVVAAASTEGPGLYEVYQVPVCGATETGDERYQPGMVMIDPGSDTNFITHSLAAKLQLQGQPYQFKLKVVDLEARPIQTARYRFQVEDRFGNKHTIQAMGLESITTLPSDPDLSPIQHLVESYPPDVLNRPQGEVDILPGVAQLRPAWHYQGTVGRSAADGIPIGMRVVAPRVPPGAAPRRSKACRPLSQPPHMPCAGQKRTRIRCAFFTFARSQNSTSLTS